MRQARMERILGLNLRRFLTEVLGDLEHRRTGEPARGDGVARTADSQ